MSHCILLNQDYSFLNIVNWKRALGMVVKEKVQVLAYSDKTVRTSEGRRVLVPAVIRLVKLIRMVYRSRIPYTKRNVLIRDGFRCAYCGSTQGKLTVDHVIPRSRGGRDGFENCVACCKTCNNFKGSRTPREAGMRLSTRPYQPTISEFLRLKALKFGIQEILREVGLS